MSEHISGPYDDDRCHFCGKSAKNGVKHTAGFQRRETYAGVGPWFDACQACAEKPYDQPKQFQQEASHETN